MKRYIVYYHEKWSCFYGREFVVAANIKEAKIIVRAMNKGLNLVFYKVESVEKIVKDASK